MMVVISFSFFFSFYLPKMKDYLMEELNEEIPAKSSQKSTMSTTKDSYSCLHEEIWPRMLKKNRTVRINSKRSGTLLLK